MKYLLLFGLFMLTACGSGSFGGNNDVVAFYAPAKGTIIAADSSRIVEDNLNESYFAVAVVSGDSSASGRYNLVAHHGYNEAKTEVVYPRLTKNLRPAIRKDSTLPYSYIVGFRYDDDTTFNDYVRVFATSTPGVGARIELRYLKAYYLDTASKK